MVALGLALLAGLGSWQLERAGEKRALAVARAAAARAPAVALDALPQDRGTQFLDRRIRLRGSYRGDARFLVDNRMRDGVPGYAVLEPFAPAGGGPWVLVNRGWVAAPAGREHPPAVPPAPAAVEVTVLGTLRAPYRPGLLARTAPERLAPGLWRVLAEEPKRFEHLLKRPLAPLVLHLEPGTPEALAPLPDVPDLSPERHVAYAVQWFAIGAALVVVYVLLGLRRGSTRDGG